MKRFQKIQSYQSHSWYPWLIWFLASSFIFYKYVLQVSPSIMIPELMAAFHLSGESMGNLSAFYFYAYLVMQFPVGILLDKYSPRYLMTGAIIVCAGGAFIFASATTLSTAEIGRLLIGIGGAFSAVGTMKLISLWFPANRFALVSGLMMSMAMLGAIGGEAPLAYLVDGFGWRSALHFCALVGFGLAILIYLFIRDNKKPAPQDSDSQLPNFFTHIKKLLRSKQVWLISIYSGLAFAPVSAFAGLWGVPFILEKYQLSKGAAAGLVSLAFIGFALGSPFAGWFSDKIQRRKPLMIIGTAFSLLTLSFIIYGPVLHKELLAILFILFGCFSGFFFVSFAHIREINPPECSGTSIGFINMFDALFGSLSEPFIGKLLDWGWDGKTIHGARYFSVGDYQHALLLLPIVLVIALLLQCFIKETYCKQKH